MYKVFIPKKKIDFSYRIKSMWSCDYEERTLKTSKEIFLCKRNEFTTEEKSIEEIHKMKEKGFVFFPINKGTKASDIKIYLERGFKVAFLCEGEFKKFKKDYKDFI